MLPIDIPLSSDASFEIDDLELGIRVENPYPGHTARLMTPIDQPLCRRIPGVKDFHTARGSDSVHHYEGSIRGHNLTSEESDVNC